MLGGAQEMAGEVGLGQLANRSHEQTSLQHGEVPKSMMGALRTMHVSAPRRDVVVVVVFLLLLFVWLFGLVLVYFIGLI